MRFISSQTVSLALGPFDIGPTGTLAAVETRYISGPHLHEIGLPGSTFGRWKQLSAVSNQLLIVHQDNAFWGVILRSVAGGETTKNLEILRYAQDDIMSVSSRSLSLRQAQGRL